MVPLILMSLMTALVMSPAAVAQLSEPPLYSLEEAQSRAREMRVTCESPASCPGQVALFATLWQAEDSERYFINRCTAFLITPEIAVTAAHCIPDGEPRSLQGRMVLHFPQTGNLDALQVGVLRVLSIAPPPTAFGDLEIPDYAFLLVESPQPARGALTLSTRVPTPGAYASVYVVDPQTDPRSEGHGVLRVQSVTVMDHNELSHMRGIHISDWPAFFSFRGTRVHVGNSGGPVVLPSSSEVIGVVHATERRHGLATTAACVPLPQALRRSRRVCPERRWNDYDVRQRFIERHQSDRAR